MTGRGDRGGGRCPLQEAAPKQALFIQFVVLAWQLCLYDSQELGDGNAGVKGLYNYTIWIR